MTGHHVIPNMTEHSVERDIKYTYVTINPLHSLYAYIPDFLSQLKHFTTILHDISQLPVKYRNSHNLIHKNIIGRLKGEHLDY